MGSQTSISSKCGSTIFTDGSLGIDTSFNMFSEPALGLIDLSAVITLEVFRSCEVGIICGVYAGLGMSGQSASGLVYFATRGTV